MNKHLVIDGKEYKNYTEEEPERKILFSDIKDNRFYDLILPEHYKLLSKNCLLYYSVDELKHYFNFGYLLKYIDPNIFIFIDTKLFNIWSIQIDESVDVYIKDPKKVKEENIQKENLWKLYQEGHITIN